MAIEKPPHGAPCNGCGMCCSEELCPLAEKIFGSSKGPCPALTQIGDRYSCGVIVSPELYDPIRAHRHGKERLSAAAAQLLGSGLGCDARNENEPMNVLFMVQLSLALSLGDVLSAHLWDFEICLD